MAKRRMGKETSATRARLLDVTVELMVADGYAAVSSRAVAARAGVKAPLVHYYFESVDDLFVAAFRRSIEGRLDRLADALRGPAPMRALWEFANDRRGRVLTIEFLALANHRKAIRAEMSEAAQRYREIELEAVERVLAEAGLDPEQYPAAGILFVLTAVPTTMALEEMIDLSTGHRDAVRLVERALAQLDEHHGRTADER